MAGTERRRGKVKGLVIQERDRVFLTELSIMRVADRDHAMAAAGFRSITRVNTRLLALHRAGLLRRFFIGSLGGRKALYALSPKGAQVIGVPCRGPRRRQDELLVADFSVLHQLAVNDVYCRLRFGTIPVPGIAFVQWVAFTEPPTDHLPLIPDGYIEFRTQAGIDASFVEVDLGTEEKQVWKEKAAHYHELAKSGAYARRFGQSRFRVLVLVNSLRRLQSIRAAVATVTPKIFWFATLDDTRREECFGPVWLRPTGTATHPLFEQPR